MASPLEHEALVADVTAAAKRWGYALALDAPTLLAAEAAALPPAARAKALADWLAAARRRLEAQGGAWVR
jgi:hypothetical protein